MPPAEIAAVEVEGFLRGLHRRLTRFEPDSDLSILNADPSPQCSVSPLLALALRAGLWSSAELTDGLVDPTLIDQLERAGYAESRVGVEPAPLRDALAGAPQRRAARPHQSSRWREFIVDQQAGVVQRPPGVRFDTGGSGKGLAADLASGRLAKYTTHAVDAGGDIRIGGSAPVPRLVEIDNPLGDEPAFEFELAAGAVASSGLASRVWHHGDSYAHHLIDPSTGEPAWTGVIQASALADTALKQRQSRKRRF